jgi:hypothetical protein
MDITRLFELSGIEYSENLVESFEKADNFNSYDNNDFQLFKELKLFGKYKPSNIIKESDDGFEHFSYEGSCINCSLFHYDATMMSNAIDVSQLLKLEYLGFTNIFQVSPKSVQKFLSNHKPVVLGYYKNLLWLYYPHVDKHFFYVADDYLKISNEHLEHTEQDRGI